MTIAAFALIVAAVVLLVVLGRRALARVERQVSRREAALARQEKTLIRRIARTEAEAAEAVQAARVASREVQKVLCDPLIQEALSGRR